LLRIRATRLLATGCTILLAFAPALKADDACEGLDLKAAQILLRPLAPHPETWEEEEGGVTAVSQLHLAKGEGGLLTWRFGAAGRIECAFLAYRMNGGPYKLLRSSSSHLNIKDIDRDGVDELVTFDRLTWGMDCGSSMATLPNRLRILHLDATSGSLLDVTRSYGGYVGDFLKDLKSDYDSSAKAMGQQTEECDRAWVELLKETYELAWFRLILAGSVISLITFVMGLSKSPRWRWAARVVGIVTLGCSAGIAFYSLGSVGWHCMGFCEAWSALQIVTGFHVHSAFLDVLSLVITALGGGRLLLSSLR
jgi:hypothetical protein